MAGPQGRRERVREERKGTHDGVLAGLLGGIVAH